MWTIADSAELQNLYNDCEGECGAEEEHVMAYDKYDVMRIEVPRDGSFAMTEHHPLVAGRLPDGRISYVFGLSGEDGLVYAGSGPSLEETRFLQRTSDKSDLIRASPSPSARLYLDVLRYDPDSYMECGYYADKMQSKEAGMDSTDPFSWRFYRYLPAIYHTHTNP